MALLFGVGQSTSLASAILTALPISFSAWFQPNSPAATSIIMAIDIGNPVTNGVQCYVNASLLPRAGSTAASVATAANGTVALGLGTWNHVCAVFASTTSRSIYLNGGNKVTDVTSSAPAGMTRTWLGSNSALQSCTGVIALPCFWNIALSDAQVATLAQGEDPYTVATANIVSAPLLTGGNPDSDRIGTVTWTPAAGPQAAPGPPGLQFLFTTGTGVSRVL